MTKMRSDVLVAIETLGGGGAERVALDLARHWPRDHATAALLVASRYGEYVHDLRPDIPVLEVGISTSPRDMLPFLLRLGTLLRGRRIAGVVSHLTAMNRMMLRAGLAGVVRAPIVAVEHNDFTRTHAQMSRPRSWLLRTEVGFLYRRAHAVVGCSEGVASQIGNLFSIDRRRLRAIPNPLDRRFLRKATMEPSIANWFRKLKRPVLVSVGRMVPQKGFDDLVRAFAMLGQGSLVILGQGPLRSELAALAQDLGVADRIAMPGFLSAPEQVLQAADLYVSASRWEGYPLTLIEAFACGLPVVARACDFGVADIVRPDRPGALVRSDCVADLADAIAECLKSVSCRTPPASIDLRENDADYVAMQYRNLFS